MEYGGQREGYWTSEKFMSNVKDAAAIANFKYPSDKYAIIWPFNQSSCHRAFAEDSLNVLRMNKCPGGGQSCMRDTMWQGQVQKLVDDNGDSVSTDTIRKYFRKVQEYERAYREGKNAGLEVEQAVKKYKSHRRVFFESSHGEASSHD